MNLYYNNTEFMLHINDSKIPDAGKGLFTDEDIEEETFIGYYEGELLKKSDLITDYSFEVSTRYFLDASIYPRCYIAMVNDATNTKYKNNCEFRMTYYNYKGKILPIKERKIGLYSINKIKKGEELYADYGVDYWLTRSYLLTS